MKKNKILLVSLFVVFAALIWSVPYLYCFKSDAYQKAFEYSSSNSVVNEKIGKILNSRLGFFNFHISQGINYGTAEFTLVLSGEKEAGEIYFFAKQRFKNYMDC